MSQLRAGVDFHPENEGCRPMSELQEMYWHQTMLEMLRSPRERLVLAGERPDTRYRLRSQDGIIEFSIRPWAGRQTITPNFDVYAEVHDSNSQAMPIGEVAILGATEDGLREKCGTIDQYADLAVQPLYRRLLIQEERDLPEEEFQTQVADGRILQAHASDMFYGRGTVRFVPVVASLQRLTPLKGKKPETIFDMRSKD